MRNCVGSWYCCDTYYGVRAAGDRDVWLGRPVVLCVETRGYAAVLWYDERPLVAGVCRRGCMPFFWSFLVLLDVISEFIAMGVYLSLCSFRLFLSCRVSRLATAAAWLALSRCVEVVKLSL